MAGWKLTSDTESCQRFCQLTAGAFEEMLTKPARTGSRRPLSLMQHPLVQRYLRQIICMKNEKSLCWITGNCGNCVFPPALIFTFILTPRLLLTISLLVSSLPPGYEPSSSIPPFLLPLSLFLSLPLSVHRRLRRTVSCGDLMKQCWSNNGNFCRPPHKLWCRTSCLRGVMILTYHWAPQHGKFFFF